MADLLSLSFSPTTLTTPASASLRTIQPLPNGALAPSTATPAIVSGTSNPVELSSTGQLLSAVSTFSNNLQVLQTSAVANTTSPLTATAQGLVDAFNGLQRSASAAQNIGGASSSTSSSTPLANQLTQTLNDFARATQQPAAAGQPSLQNIGITAQNNLSPTTLSLDLSTLNTAFNSNSPATRTALADATQSLIALTTAFETSASQTITLPASLGNLNELGRATTPARDLNNLPAPATISRPETSNIGPAPLPISDTDAALRVIDITNTGLTARNLDAAAVLANGLVLRNELSAAQPAPGDQPSEPASNQVNISAANQSATNASQLGKQVNSATTLPPSPANDEQPADAGITRPGAPIATAATIINSTSSLPGTPPAETEVAVTERRSSEASQTLQTLLDTPGRRAFRNQFDPSYSALIAAAHLSNFISSDTRINPKSLTNDAVRPVSATTPSRAIAYYNEAADEEARQLGNRTETLSSRQLLNTLQRQPATVSIA